MKQLLLVVSTKYYGDEMGRTCSIHADMNEWSKYLAGNLKRIRQLEDMVIDEDYTVKLGYNERHGTE
jgi:hypothetical protein